MNQGNSEDFSTVKITPQLISQIIEALKNKGWGSVEIFVENYTVTQITERTINKVAGPKNNKPFAQVKPADKSLLPDS